MLDLFKKAVSTKLKHLQERKKRKWFVIYSEHNNYKLSWDLFQSTILIYSCFVTPLIICFNFESTTLSIFNNCIDLLFLVDMLIIFNTAVTTENFETIDDHKFIAMTYI